MKKQPKPVLAWGGFVDGRLCEDRVSDGYGGCLMPSVFKDRPAALVRFSDVRRVRIVPVKPKRRAKR